MIRKLIWKEWRENRWKYAALWLVFNSPLLIMALVIAFVPASRTAFADLSDRTVMKYLPLALGESFLVVSIFFLATALVAVAAFRPPADQSMFFIFEQPISRRRYAAARILNGAVHVALAVCVALLLAPAGIYALMLISGKVTLAGSGGTFLAILGAAARALLWCSLISIAVFAGSALISAVLPRWWMAAVCAIGFILLFGTYIHRDNSLFGGSEFLQWFPDVEGKSYNISANSGSPQWLTVSDVLPMPTTFARWKTLPLVASTALIVLFSAGVATVYQRKELK
jgi:hypothetical protein